MPTADQILAASTQIANRGFALAIAWHAVIAVVIVMTWRRVISRRTVAIVLAAASATVSVMAWSTINPFNGSIFALLAVTQILMVRHPAPVTAAPESRAAVLVGSVFLAFGWCYPHFLAGRDPWVYAYAAPLGLLPCPTLSMMIGVSFICGLFAIRRWAALLGSAAFLYGVIGVALLGVEIDLILILAAMVALASNVSTLGAARQIPAH